MDYVHLYIRCGELYERVAQSLYGSVHIGLYDKVEFVEIAHLDTAAQLVESKSLCSTHALLTLQLLTLAGNLTGLTLAVHDMEAYTGLGSTVQTQDQHRLCGSG